MSIEKIVITGARGENLGDILRRTGQFGVLESDTDTEVMTKFQASVAADQVADAEAAAAAAAQDADDAEDAAAEAVAARDYVAASGNLQPARSALSPSLVFGDSGDIVEFPDGSLAAPTAARDCLFVAFAVTPAGAGGGQFDTLFGLTTQATGSTRSIYLDHLGNDKDLRFTLNATGVSMLSNPVFRGGGSGLLWGPLERMAVMYGVIGGIPHFAAVRFEDGATMAIKGDDLHQPGTSQFNSTAQAATINRVGGVLQVARTSHGVQTGQSVLIDGIGARVATKIDNDNFTCPDPGADETDAATQYYTQASQWAGLSRIFRYCGALSNGGNAWNGGGAGLVSMRHSTAEIPGDFSDIVNADGWIDPAWLATLGSGGWTELPGSNAYTVDVGDVGSEATGSLSGAAGDPTWTVPSARETVAIDQPNWLRPKSGDLHNMVHAAELGQMYGTVVIPFTYTGLERGVLARLYDGDVGDVAGSTMLWDWTSAEAAADMVSGEGEIRLHKVPMNATYWARFSIALPSGTAGTDYFYFDAPVPVGPVFGVNQQSLEGTILSSPTDEGTVTIPAGLATITSSWERYGYPADATTNRKEFARSTNTRINTSDFREGIQQMAAVALDHLSDVLGRDGAFRYVHLALNGHNKRDQALDGQTFTLDAGTATAGVELTGTFDPPGAESKWTEPWTVEVEVDGQLVATDDADSRSGDVAPLFGQITDGQWNYTTGDFSVTIPFGGEVTVRARIRMSSSSVATTRINYGSEQEGDAYSYFGLDPVPGNDGSNTGYIRDQIIAAQTMSCIVDSWDYSARNTVTGTLADAKAAFIEQEALIEARWLRQPELYNRRTGDPIPVIWQYEQRTTNGNEFVPPPAQRLRFLREQVAAEQGKVFLPGCLTCELEADISAHAAGYGKQLVTVQRTLALWSYWGSLTGEAFTAKDHHTIRRLLAIERLDTNVLKFYFTFDPDGIGQHDPGSAGFAGLWYGANRANGYVDTSSGYPYSIDSAACTLTITKNSGAFAAGYYDINRHSVIPNTVGSKAVQNALLPQTLCVLNGEYPAALNRRGDDIHPSNTETGIYVA